MDAIYRAKRARPSAVIDPRAKLALEIKAYKEHELSMKRWGRREIFDSEYFWVHQCAAFVHLAPLARAVCSVPSSSADIERVFSFARNMTLYNQYNQNRRSFGTG